MNKLKKALTLGLATLSLVGSVFALSACDRNNIESVAGVEYDYAIVKTTNVYTLHRIKSASLFEGNAACVEFEADCGLYSKYYHSAYNGFYNYIVDHGMYIKAPEFYLFEDAKALKNINYDKKCPDCFFEEEL